MTRITVIPAPGRLVPDPESGDLLPADGRGVIDSPYWRRRINDGDVIARTAPRTKKESSK